MLSGRPSAEKLACAMASTSCPFLPPVQEKPERLPPLKKSRPSPSPLPKRRGTLRDLWL